MAAKTGIDNGRRLLDAIREKVAGTNLEEKSRDFVNMLFDPSKASCVLAFQDCIENCLREYDPSCLPVPPTGLKKGSITYKTCWLN